MSGKASRRKRVVVSAILAVFALAGPAALFVLTQDDNPLRKTFVLEKGCLAASYNPTTDVLTTVDAWNGKSPFCADILSTVASQ